MHEDFDSAQFAFHYYQLTTDADEVLSTFHLSNDCMRVIELWLV